MTFSLSVRAALFALGMLGASVSMAQQTQANQIYGGFWAVDGSTSTDLSLEAVNADVAATVVVYSSSGSQLAAQSVSLSVGSVSHVSLTRLLAGTGNGGLMVQWAADSGWVRGAVTVTRNNGVAASYPLTAPSVESADVLYAPWYFPDSGTNGTLSLFNSGSTALQVDIRARANGKEEDLQTISIQPDSSQLLDLKSLLQGTDLSQAGTGSIVLEYSGTVHPLQPVLFLANATTGFALMPTFAVGNLPQNRTQATWHFPDVPISSVPAKAATTAASTTSTITSYALLANGTGSPLTPQIVSYALWGLNAKSHALTIPALAPYETRLVNLSQLVKQQWTSPNPKLVPPNLSGVTVTHPGPIGDLEVSIFTATASGSVQETSSGLILPTQAGDIGYWARKVPAPKYHVTNATPSTMVTLYYQDTLGIGSYTTPMPPQTTPKASFEMADVLQPGSQDANGDILPAGIESGLLILNQASAASTTATPAATATTAAAATSTNSTTQTAALSPAMDGARPEFSADEELPRPCIYMYQGGWNCVNDESLSVTVGQQIKLAACVPSEYVGDSTQSWGSPGGTIIGGYTNAAGTGAPDTTGGVVQSAPVALAAVSMHRVTHAAAVRVITDQPSPFTGYTQLVLLAIQSHTLTKYHT
jgi:hypothetical protein